MESLPLTPEQVIALLDDAGIPQVETIAVPELQDLPDAFARVGASPVVLKAGGLLHKSDDGGVVLGLRTLDEVTAAATSLHWRLGARALPLLIQPQASGLELLIGLRREPGLGASSSSALAGS